MAEVSQLLDQEIPEGRQHLQESYVNLDKVAQYCRDNYLKSQDKKAALEETKNYTTHSLASVAYQINSLATNFLKLLDLQQNVMAEMESSVNYLSQTVNIHKEKVARREIGVLTTNKSSNRPLGVKNGIIFPEHNERPTKYQRKAIDFTLLDEIGHGVKPAGGVPRQQPSRTPSVSSQRSVHQAPTTQPPNPPQPTSAAQQNQKGPYRTPAPPVAPPSIPMNGPPGPGPFNAQPQSNYSMGQITALPGQHTQNQPGQRRTSTDRYSQNKGGPDSRYSQNQGLPESRYSQNQGVPESRYSQNQGRHSQNQGSMDRRSQNQGIPPSVGMVHPQSRPQVMPQTSIDNLPPPPSPEVTGDTRNSEILEASPPLPPPPPASGNQGYDYSGAPPPAQFSDVEEPHPDEETYARTGGLNMLAQDMVPNQYLEKVIAIYDYEADKDDELSFTENSVIYVLKKNDDGWYEGVCNGVTGLFPGNYVEPCM